MASLLAHYLAGKTIDRSGNCLTFAADWVRLAIGRDPAAAWRGSRDDPGAWVRMRGGKTAIASAAMASCGLDEVASAEPGDVALVRVVGRRPLVGAICVNAEQWAVRTTDFALTVAGPPAIVPAIIWRVPWRN